MSAGNGYHTAADVRYGIGGRPVGKVKKAKVLGRKHASDVRQPKANLSNTFGIKATAVKAKSAVTQTKPKAGPFASAKAKVRGK